MLLLLFEDEGRVLLLGDVDVVAGVRGGHDVARAGVQEDALVVLPLHSDQTHTIPAEIKMDFSSKSFSPKDINNYTNEITY